jgi:glycosyltransferase involved in cell wall biosynthesis
LRLASRWVSGAIAISPAVAADLKILGLEGRTRLIANALDVHEYCPAPAEGPSLDELARLPSASCLRVGLIASYARWKGHGVFLEAAALLANSRPALPVRFYVIGGPIYQTRGSQYEQRELRNLAGRLGVADRIGFIDFQANVAPIYRGLDVVVHASTAPEPFGLTIIEAMACGKPVVASLAGGVVDIIEPGRDALGVPPGDAPALASALHSLLGDSSLRFALGEQARRTVCERFDQRRIGPEVLEVYRALTEAPPLHPVDPRLPSPCLVARPS